MFCYFLQSNLIIFRWECYWCWSMKYSIWRRRINGFASLLCSLLKRSWRISRATLWIKRSRNKLPIWPVKSTWLDMLRISGKLPWFDFYVKKINVKIQINGNYMVQNIGPEIGWVIFWLLRTFLGVLFTSRLKGSIDSYASIFGSFWA